MRIGFLGKGGAGKTTMAAGFTKYASRRHPFVLAVDADCNAHLKTALGLDEEPLQLGEFYDEIMDYLKGDRIDLGNRPFICTMPPSVQSKFVNADPADPLIARYALHQDNIGLLTVGPYETTDVGSSCYHTKLMGMTAVFHHLLDSAKDIIVADTTAGTDNVASSLNFVYDINLFVVEPTLKSVNVYLDFIKVVPHLSDRTFIVANKVDGQEDRAFLGKHLPGEKILGTISISRDLKHFEQGDRQAGTRFYDEQEATFASIYDALCNKSRDWKQYLTYLREAHDKVCKEWWNSFYATDLTTNLDESFSYQAVAEQKHTVVNSVRELVPNLG